jgi:hypothetical protein
MNYSLSGSNFNIQSAFDNLLCLCIQNIFSLHPKIYKLKIQKAKIY